MLMMLLLMMMTIWTNVIAMPTSANIRAHAIREQKNKPSVHQTNKPRQKTNKQTKAKTKNIRERFGIIVVILLIINIVFTFLIILIISFSFGFIIILIIIIFTIIIMKNTPRWSPILLWTTLSTKHGKTFPTFD